MDQVSESFGIQLFNFKALEAESPMKIELSRNLTPDEIKSLQSTGNTSSNWNSVYLISNANTVDSSRIRNCMFDGFIVIEDFTNKVLLHHGISTDSGIYNSNFYGTCILGENCLISNVRALKNVVIGGGASIIDCGFITGEKLCPINNNIKVVVGPETGGREIIAAVNHNYSAICHQALYRNQNYPSVGGAIFLDEKLSVKATVIGHSCKLFRCDTISNCYVGHFAEGTASSLVDCTLLSTQQHPIKILEGCSLTSTLMHGGSSSSGPSCHISSAVIFDYSSIGSHTRAEHIVLGPDANISHGEVLHSLLGPFIGIHHTSLCIATLWPFGRGNIAYGAMVGANHTGRMNDQESLLGEGIFFGLGVTTKFPLNMVASPYTIVATGCSLSPQRIAFPFSLLSPLEGEGSTGSGGSGWVSGGCSTRIAPGWVLWANPYFLERCDSKFKSRSKSKFHCTTFPVCRNSIILLVHNALQRLQSITGSGIQPWYTEVQIAGLGKNVCTEKDRLKAIEAYGDYLRRFALQGLMNQLQSVNVSTWSEYEPIIITACPTPTEIDLATIPVTTAIPTLSPVISRTNSLSSTTYNSNNNYGSHSSTNNNNNNNTTLLSNIVMEDLILFELPENVREVEEKDDEEKKETIETTSTPTSSINSIPPPPPPTTTTTTSTTVSERRKSKLWSLQKSLLLSLFNPEQRKLANLMSSHVLLERTYYHSVCNCRTRDEQRGKTIIPDYEAVHGSADTDPIVRNALEKLEAVTVIAGQTLSNYLYFQRNSNSNSNRIA